VFNTFEKVKPNNRDRSNSKVHTCAVLESQIADFTARKTFLR